MAMLQFKLNARSNGHYYDVLLIEGEKTYYVTALHVDTVTDLGIQNYVRSTNDKEGNKIPGYYVDELWAELEFKPKPVTIHDAPEDKPNGTQL